jgi:hypothetical protein
MRAAVIRKDVRKHYYYRYSALGPVRAETRAQSGDWNGSDTLHSRQILRGSLPLLSPVRKLIGTFCNYANSYRILRFYDILYKGFD